MSNNLDDEMRAMGYVPKTEFVLHDFDEVVKDVVDAERFHSFRDGVCSCYDFCSITNSGVQRSHNLLCYGILVTVPCFGTIFMNIRSSTCCSNKPPSLPWRLIGENFHI
ncbi:hypothetical protein NE237_012253 [Protea cynaroides]|uniref:Uncharacterized protein n=1 Tax=Protea cynaroides TaxID=273540 RepID=A0A9Q0GXQ8_9MAGN|nr:hypothetical protein NE237_012253 [Protea cynaroides]